MPGNLGVESLRALFCSSSWPKVDLRSFVEAALTYTVRHDADLPLAEK